MLELRNVNFERDGNKILNNISLKIEGNKFVVITGPNGSGKSTLAKIIMGIEKLDSGKIYFNGKNITNLPIDKRSKLGISFAFQTPVRFKGITVHDLLELSIKHKIEKKEACNILSKVGLCARDYTEREINNSLSGGELKRIEIASVIAKKPELAIFDEPEAGIDLWSFQNLISVFNELRNNSKGLTLVISHQERILNIADEIILIKNGKIDKIGKKEDIINDLYNDTKCVLEVQYEQCR